MSDLVPSDLSPLVRPPADPGVRVLYGTVDTVIPLTVIIDGDTDASPVVGCVTATAGDRVVMLLQARVLTAIGVVGGCPHAVGDYWLTESSTAPADRWPTTTWVEVAGRMLIGKDSGTFSSIGAEDGHETHTLTAAEIPSHDHGIPHAEIGASGTARWTVYSGGTGTTRTGTAGGGGAHDNMPPYRVVHIWRRTA